jgi:hypothetical protein
MILSVGVVGLSPSRLYVKGQGEGDAGDVGPRESASPTPRPRKSKLLGTQFLGLGDPPINAARQANLFADIVSGGRAEAGDLPVMEDS